MVKGKIKEGKSDISSISIGIISRAFGVLSKHLLALAEDPVKWSVLSERIRQDILKRLHSKQIKQVKPVKRIRDQKKK